MSAYTGQSYSAANTANTSYVENSTEVSAATLEQLMHLWKTKQLGKLNLLLKLNNLTIQQAIAAYNDRSAEKRENKRTIIKDIVESKKMKAEAQLAEANKVSTPMNYTPIVLLVAFVSLLVFWFKKRKK